jgi:hypothetical protein
MKQKAGKIKMGKEANQSKRTKRKNAKPSWLARLRMLDS